VPYLYLPQDTCDAIAAHLPVTYNADYNLYIWNSNSQAYKEIVSSPHFLSFTFSAGSGGSTIINVPFALLNLTLETPIIGNPVQYFPCSPWKPDAAGYTLGRSFLQAAFLAQNWNTSTLFLAQAPGPDFLPANIKDIGVTDTTLSPAENPPSWESTWSSTLKPLSPNTGGGTTTSTTTSKSSSGTSGGTIAGIVVGVIVGVALVVGLIVIFLIRSRRQKQKGWQSGGEQEELRPYHGRHASAPPNYYDAPIQAEKRVDDQAGDVQHAPLVEAPDNARNPAELDAYVPAQELETQQATKNQ